MLSSLGIALEQRHVASLGGGFIVADVEIIWAVAKFTVVTNAPTPYRTRLHQRADVIGAAVDTTDRTANADRTDRCGGLVVANDVSQSIGDRAPTFHVAAFDDDARVGATRTDLSHFRADVDGAD